MKQTHIETYYLQNKFGDTALFGACRGGHAETARILLDYGANVDLKNKVRNYRAPRCL